MIEHLLTPEGRERLSGGWAKLPKVVRMALRTVAYVTGAGVALGLIVWVTVVVCMALSAAGFDGLAIFVGICGAALVLGSVCGLAVYAAEKD